MWDIEGHLADALPEPVPVAGGMMRCGLPMRSMWMHQTVDKTAMIVAAQAVTDAGPYGQACGTIAPDYAQLVGVRVARGYLTRSGGSSAAPPAART